MVLPYMVTWIPSIYPLYVSIYTSTMDPMGLGKCSTEKDMPSSSPGERRGGTSSLRVCWNSRGKISPQAVILQNIQKKIENHDCWHPLH